MSAKIPSIGTLRDKVQLEAKNMVDDGAGGHLVSYSSIANVWANVSPSNGRSVQIADANSVSISHVVLLRFRSDLEVGHRIIYRSRTLEILSVNDLNGHKAYLQCFCSETVVAG
ncbi:MAG: phage head closure protein [Devosiaceae bacterium]|nr:phage head closure protein [Devosiaceae bacterium]